MVNINLNDTTNIMNNVCNLSNTHFFVFSEDRETRIFAAHHKKSEICQKLPVSH